MRLRFSSVAALIALSLGFAPAARAVVVQGFEVTALGSSTVSAVVTASSPPRRLVNSLIGPSGQDGADFQLYRSSGIQLTFEEPTSPGGTIERRNLTLYTNGPAPGEQIPIIKGSALGSGGSSERKINCPYVFTVTVEVWSGSTLMLSKDLPISTVVAVSEGSDVTPPGGTVYCYTHHKGGGASVGSPKLRLSMGELWPTPRDVTVDGETVTGDELVFEVESEEFPASFDGAELKCATNVAALINGNVVIGNLSLIKDPPYVAPRMAHAAVALSLGDDMLHVTDPEHGSYSYSVEGGPGGGGGGQVRMGPVGRRPSLTWARDRWTFGARPPGTDGLPITTAIDVECDDLSGTPPQVHEISCTVTPNDGFSDLIANTGIPTDEISVQAFDDGRAAGPPTTGWSGVHCSSEPIAIRIISEDGSTSIEYDFAAGTTFDVQGGATFTGNMLHMHSVSVQNFNRRISDVRIVHPPGTPPGTWRCMQANGSYVRAASELCGLELAARGPRQTVSLDGSYGGGNKRLVMQDIPGGGIEMALNGAASVAIESAPDVGAPPLPFESMALYDCDTGDCDPASLLGIEYDAASHVVKATCQWNETPQVCGLQLGHTVMSMASADIDGDGAITVTSANAAIEPRSILKSYRWISPSTECMTVSFADPVQVATLTGVHVVTELTFWRNLDGGPLGKTKPKPKGSSCGLPPGTPYIGNRMMPIRPPAVLSSGDGIVRADVGVMRAGVPVTSTWATATNVRITGDTDGDLRVMRDWQHHPLVGEDPPVLEATTSDPACPGFVYEFKSSPPSLVWSPRSNIRLYGRGDMAGMPPNSELNGIECESGGGIPDVVRYVPGNLGGQSLATLSLNGVDVASALANEVEVSRKYNIVLEADIDADGTYEIVCLFPPGTTATLPGQPPVAIDKLKYVPWAPDRWILRYRAAGLSLAGLPPGIPVDDFTLARIMAPGSNVDVPPATPPIAGLEFRGVMPNPARGASTIRLALGHAARLRVQVLDVAGREIARLADGERPAGEHAFTWSGTTSRGTRVGAGLYFVRVSGEGLPTQTTRMIRLD